MSLAPLSASFQSLPPGYPQANRALLVLIPSGWACVCSATLWVSSVNSAVHLGVSPAAASAPTGVFNQRFEALSPHPGALCCMVCFAPQLLFPVYLQANVGPPAQPAASLSKSSPPCCLSLPLLPVWMNVSSSTAWLSDFHTVRFSVSSGCFFFLNLLLSFFWLCEETQCVYLRLHLGWKFSLFFLV